MVYLRRPRRGSTNFRLSWVKQTSQKWFNLVNVVQLLRSINFFGPMHIKICYLTALPHPVVPMTGQFINFLRIEMEKNIQNILICQLYSTLNIDPNQLRNQSCQLLNVYELNSFYFRRAFGIFFIGQNFPEKRFNYFSFYQCSAELSALQ